MSLWNTERSVSETLAPGTFLLASLTLFVWNSILVTSPVMAQEGEKASSRLEGLQVQPGDEPLKKFEPSRPDPANEKGKRAAMALYMKGRIEQEQGRFTDALQSYLAAVDQDPQAIDAYKGALPILLQRQEIDRARKLTLAAAEQNDAGIELVVAMAAVFARQSQLSEGIQLLQSVLMMPNLKAKSLQDLYVRRDLGLYLRLQGNFTKAAEEYKYVFDAIRDPQLDEETRKKLLIEPGKLFDDFGDVFLKAEQPELALEAFDEANKYREAKPGINSFNLATVFRQTGKPEKALEELQHYFDAQMQTRGRAAYELLDELLTQLERKQELIPRLEELYKLDEHNDSLRYFLADQILKTGDLDRATVLYTNGRDKISDPRALVGMLSVYRQQKESEKLLGVLTRAFSTVPRADDKAALQQMAPDVRTLANRFEEEIQALLEDEETFSALTAYARTLEEGDEPKIEFLQAYILGKLSTENDRIEDAIHFYKVAISMRNDPPAMLFTELSSQLVDSQHYDEAVEILNEAIKHPSTGLQREKWRFLYLLSYALAFQGKTDEALDVIHDAQKLQPIPMMQYQEAWIVYHARRWDDALALFEQIIANHPDDKELANRCRFHVSNIYVEKGDMPKGEKVLEDVLAENPDSPQANNDLGYLYADQGKNLERAEGMIRKALEAEPENHAYLDSLGWVLFKQGKYEEALVPLEKASQRKQGDDSTIFDHYADCLEKLGRHEDAAAAWERALKAEKGKSQPNEKLLKSIREKLKLPESEEKPEAAPSKSSGEKD
ncbi:MAG TPA: tetratricopeptide repeat protein [Planctomicrobium sp.]|nr:tetratricopeptide repeat protein [Planctomicrobium sp.]